MSSGYVWLTPAAPAAVGVLQMPMLAAAFDGYIPPPPRVGLRHLLTASGAVADEVMLRVVGQDTLEVATHGGAGIRAAVEAALQSHGLAPQSDTLPAGQDARWRALAVAPCPAARDLLLAGRESTQQDEWLRRVPSVLIAGPPNAGKSTLINAWCGRARALVSERAGTTRDLLLARTTHRGWHLDLLDSAGLRTTADDLEAAGQALVERARRRADVVLWLAPPTGSGHAQPEPNDLLVSGKADLRPEKDGDSDAVLRWAGPQHVGAAASETMLTMIADAVLARLGIQV